MFRYNVRSLIQKLLEKGKIWFFYYCTGLREQVQLKYVSNKDLSHMMQKMNPWHQTPQGQTAVKTCHTHYFRLFFDEYTFDMSIQGMWVNSLLHF